MVNSLRVRVRQFLESPQTFAGKAFAWFIQLLIIASLIEFAFETRPDNSPSEWRVLHSIETFTIVVFTVEYLARLWSSARPLRFAFSPLGLIDLLAVLPFYLSLGIDLRSMRAFRLFRLTRLLKLARYNSAMARFYRAFMLAKEELVLFFGAALVLLYLAAVGIFYFERSAQPEVFRSVFSSLWWAVTTLTTVGYGDSYPVTLGGRIFTFFVLMIGLGVVAIPSGIVAAALAKVREGETKSGMED